MILLDELIDNAGLDWSEEIDLGSGHDCVLDEGSSVWITVGDLSVWVRNSFGGVTVEVYPHLGEAANGPIDTLRVEGE